MVKPIVAIDVDDVLADSTESLRNVVNKTYGVNLDREHYHVPGEYSKYYDRVWEAQGIADVVAKGDLNAQMVVDQSHVPVQADAQSVLRQLAETYDLVVLTARDPAWRQASEQWLDRHFPETFSAIYFGGGKHDTEQRTKGDLCAEIGAGWLIDDNPGHLRTAMDRGVQGILFGDYGWHLDVPDDAVRCQTWKDIGDYLAG